MLKYLFSFMAILICVSHLSAQEKIRPRFSADFGATQGFVARFSYAKPIPIEKTTTFTYSGYLLAFGTDHKVEYDSYKYDPYFTSGLMLAAGPQWYINNKVFFGFDIALGAGFSSAQLWGRDPYLSTSTIDINSPYYNYFPSLMNYDALYFGLNFNKFRLRFGWGALIITGQESISIRFPISISAGFNLM